MRQLKFTRTLAEVIRFRLLVTDMSGQGHPYPTLISNTALLNGEIKFTGILHGQHSYEKLVKSQKISTLKNKKKTLYGILYIRMINKLYISKSINNFK